MKAHKVKLNGQEYLLTEEQYKEVCAALAKSAQPAARGLEMKAQEARFLWDDLDKARKDTFFLTREIADLANKAPFPPESLVRSAETAAQKVAVAIKSRDPRGIIDAIDAAQKPVEAASTALHAYLDGFFAGTDKIIATLKFVEQTCSITVSVGAAVATGGASLEIGTAVMASDGAYQALLTQIERSGTDPKFTLANGALNVLAGAAVGALTSALVGNGGFLEDLTDKLAAKMEAAVLKRFNKELAAKVAAKIVKAEISGLVGTAVGDLVKACKPGSKMTLKQAAEDVAKTMLASAALGGALSGLDHQLDGLSDKAATFFKPGVFKGLGEVDPKKAFAAGGDQIVEQAVKRLGPKLILEAASVPKSLAQIGKELAAEIAHDAKVNAEMAELVKKRKLH